VSTGLLRERYLTQKVSGNYDEGFVEYLDQAVAEDLGE